MVEYKVRVITNEGRIPSSPFATRQEAIDFINSLLETKEVRRADILNTETRERERII